MENQLNQVIREVRERKGLSQRALARRASLAYKSIQLIEGGDHDPRLSTLDKIAWAFGREDEVPSLALAKYFKNQGDDIRSLSFALSRPINDWRYIFFNFVDSFRRAQLSEKNEMICEAPTEVIEPRYMCLLASTVENLCEQYHCKVPWWIKAIGPLKKPWFVSNIENLKVMALLESPLSFRKRNIFVLSNFLDRA